MKFKSITLHNFMRYQGDNVLNFSCDAEKNVTVVLGNNTFGKTTLAQAFRWGLYEQLTTTNYATKKKDIILLNHDVISLMSDYSRQTVWVEIVIEEGTTQWRFRREATFKRRYPDTNSLDIVQDGETKLTMVVIENGVPGEVINNNGRNSGSTHKAGCVQDTINNMLPEQLANYFFFDGERWSDTKAAKSEVRESINTILGVTGLLELKKHLKDGQGMTVLKLLRSRLQGSGEEYNKVCREIEHLDADIDKYTRAIEESEKALQLALEDRDRFERLLNDNKKVEEDQKEYKRLENQIQEYQKYAEQQYADIVRLFSGSARLIASQFLPDIHELLSSIDLEGKDIPGVTTDTVDYLIEHGQCLCGEQLIEGSTAYNNMMNLRRVIPPEMIGGAAGKFQELLTGWASDSKDLLPSLIQKARDFEATKDNLADREYDRDTLGRKMDKKSNVAAIRNQYEQAKRNCRTHESAKSDATAKLTFAKERREKQYAVLDTIAKQNEANKSVQRAIDYTEAIYTMAERQAKRKQDGVFEELNSIISDNFEKMFNDGEKYARLEADYQVHVYYRDVGGRSGHEETNLSGGERTAINFVYIVSILELARRRSTASANTDEEMDTSTGVINLPLVLDAPFSTLSNENTSLIARKLPEFAEQVIIFMLDKDWESSGLDKYTLPGYCCRISKDEKSNSSSFEDGRV